jgi:hypothetical protein
MTITGRMACSGSTSLRKVVVPASESFTAELAALWKRLQGRLLRCDIHDRPSEAKIARLEVETGIDPLAEQRRWPQRQYTPDGRPLPLIIPRMDNQDLIDCGSTRCRKRRGLL